MFYLYCVFLASLNQNTLITSQLFIYIKGGKQSNNYGLASNFSLKYTNELVYLITEFVFV